jgi:hypothetical protein
MEVARELSNETGSSDQLESYDLNFLPSNLTRQCCSLIESYHEVHGYACLPDVLWKSRLGPFIESHRELRHFLRKASTTRSAKRANQGFVRIATAILSLEILASSFAGWGALYPKEAELARTILNRSAPGPRMPLMEFYLYPPKYLSSTAVVTLAPPPRRSDEADFYRASNPELAGEKQALNYVRAVQQTSDGRLPHTVVAPSAWASANLSMIRPFRRLLLLYFVAQRSA